MDKQACIFLASGMAKHVLVPGDRIEETKKFMTEKAKKLGVEIKNLEPIYLIPLMLSPDSKRLTIDPVARQQSHATWYSALGLSRVKEIYKSLEKFLPLWWARLNDFEIKVLKEGKETKEYPFKTDEDFPIYIFHEQEFFAQAVAEWARSDVLKFIIDRHGENSPAEIDLYMPEPKKEKKKKMVEVEVDED